MERPLRNPELTKKALDFIYRQGRNTLDALAKSKSRQQLIEEGWIKNRPEKENGDWL